ncbi:hypothetical protein BX616_000783 [Lobosporangium transversale]|uniref:Uncharacterized protein n=1 Tax=Lobosporangium transversale TaxID=64571 RepID=A0A1Y2GD34_9FUNG|nr:hypothetical protein BCR41DRAFT_388872 [Lobosporangium transversale]KAF9906208.1 hypothetical protein BX616_000783 [Lobosporangium transversale]ORZ07499.1 hypothetical protein BCR41DRAFT_388872 [Lobosporangium transversale]|eukprot:XP_021878006.1 hypothetical protein BCR41DRAFT_388872 [Lobosporangium transversale]
MEKPIHGDRYVRTLSHYLRSNQRRLLPPTLSHDPSTSSVTSSTTTATTAATNAAANARSFVTPADPMAAAYQGMISSLWNATSAVVNSIAPASLNPSSSDSQTRAHDKDIYYNGTTWDNPSANILQSDADIRENQLYYKAALRSPIFPLDLYYLLYLLERFEQVGIEFEGWESVTSSRTVGDSNPRVISADPSASASTVTSEAKPGNKARGEGSSPPQSIRSFSSTAVSTLTLITGWKQWSTAASFNSNNLTITDDIHFIRKFFKHVPGLRLLAKIPPGDHVQGKGRIEGFNGEAIMTLLNHGQPLSKPESDQPLKPAPPLLLLPLAAMFTSLTHLELHKIPPDCIEGWETLMKQLKSLVIIQSGIEDVYDVIITAVVQCERRRRQRALREKTRAVQIKEEQQEALKDAALTPEGLGSTTESNDHKGKAEDMTLNGTAAASTTNKNDSALQEGDEMEMGKDDDDSDDSIILASLKMWPALRHLSFSDNSLPALTHNDTFMHTPVINSLDLSHNLLLSPPSGLIHLHNLNDLNLSYNMISGVQSIYQILGNISVLDLRGNRLESLSGLERLWNLEKVDVRENHLDEAAEVGRLAALPGIREVWSEHNPFCAIQPKYRLEILAVFKANGHDILLDGTFASFFEKRALDNMGPTSFSTTISSINNVANIPAASAPVATFAKELANTSSPPPAADEALNAVTASDAAISAVFHTPVNKLVKKKLVKSTKRVKRVVNLDSDHDDDHEHDAAPVPPPVILADVDAAALEESHDNEVAAILAKTTGGVQKSPTAIKKKKKSVKTTSDAADTRLTEHSGEGLSQDQSQSRSSSNNGKNKRRIVKKKSMVIAEGSPAATTLSTSPTTTSTGATVSFAGDRDSDSAEDHTLCSDGHHVHRHRLAHLEQSLASLQMERPAGTGHQRHPPRGILKKNYSMPPNAMINAIDNMASKKSTSIVQNGVSTYGVGGSGAISPRMRPSSPIGSFSSSDEGGTSADGYRRKIEAMRNEAGKNWLMVLAEMDGESAADTTTTSSTIFQSP